MGRRCSPKRGGERSELQVKLDLATPGVGGRGVFYEYPNVCIVYRQCAGKPNSSRCLENDSREHSGCGGILFAFAWTHVMLMPNFSTFVQLYPGALGQDPTLVRSGALFNGAPLLLY